MKEKVLSLAKGNFVYAAPRLVVSPEKLECTVTAGTHHTEVFVLVNERNSKIKGFGSTETPAFEFLPVFDAKTNTLKLEINAKELIPGTHLKGQIDLITDCGELALPYDIRIAAPKLADEQGVVEDYYALQLRIRENPQQGIRLFYESKFKEVFLYRDPAGRLLYDHLTKADTQMQSLEEFLAGMGKKQAIRFEAAHGTEKYVKEISYELVGEDIQDTLQIRVNTWGSVPIQVRTTADFIKTEFRTLCTDEFENRKEVLGFTILADKVPCGRREGSIVLETPYQRREIKVKVHNQLEEKERKVERAKKAVFATLYRTFLAYQENRIPKNRFRDLLWKNKGIIEKLSRRYQMPVMGFIQVMVRDEREILDFYQQTEPIEIPKPGSDLLEVENYLLIEYVKYLYKKHEEDREHLSKLLEGYRENGYHSTILLYLWLHTSRRYCSVQLKEKDIREQLEKGENSTLMYSELLMVYRQEPALLTTLDPITIAVCNYGLKTELLTEDMAVVFSFLAERLPEFCPLIFSMLERIYVKFAMQDTLRAICSILIRNEKREHKYFPWFERGVQERLRLTDLYEYYMYTMEQASIFTLPESVLSYFQYENHLNEKCTAFLYAYIIKKREEQPEHFRIYGTHIREFALKQLAKHRITEDIGIIYEGLFKAENIQDAIAQDLPYVMFTQLLTCRDGNMAGVLVSHVEAEEEKYYPFINGQAKIELYTPNYQLYFVDKDGQYHTGTVEYTMKKLLHLDEFAVLCYKNGSGSENLLIHLAVQAERSVRLQEEQALILHNAVSKNIIRKHTRVKMLLRLYDYYKEIKDTALLLEILDMLEISHIKRTRTGEVAADCVYHGLYDKAEKILVRYGIEGCEKKALAMLTLQKIQERGGEFSAILVKWSLYLYREHFYERVILGYLLQYYMGRTEILTAIYNKCRTIPEITIDDGSKERLLGQVLFTGTNPEPYEELFLEYYASGSNRVLVKAFLSELAYEYLVDRIQISEEVFVKIEKEAFYEREKIMVLATLKYYSGMKNYAKKQQEFIELHLEEYASEGLIMTFMKEFIGKTAVPYEIENTVLIQYNSGTGKGVFLFLKNDEGRFEGKPMKQIFDGIYTKELLLFEGEEKLCYIYEEEADERTEEMLVCRPENAGSSAGFFQMINEMIKAKESGDDAGYTQIRKTYEEHHSVARQLFQIM